MSRPKRIAITGATGGVGRALCRILLERDWKILGGSRSEESCESLAEELGVEVRRVDARDRDSVDSFFESAVDRMGGLDASVNLAGSILLKPVHLVRDEEWEETIATNLTTSFHVLRASIRSFDRDAGGSVVLVSSAAASLGLPNHEAIAAAKAGIEGLARSAAATYGPKGVRVNVVAPGLTRTPLTERITSNPKALEASLEMHALGRAAEPEDVAAVIVTILENRAMTGAVVAVDGGLGHVRSR